MKNYILFILFILVFCSCEKKVQKDNINDYNEKEVETVEVGVYKPQNQHINQPYWTIENLRLREEPNIDSQIIQTLKAGTQVLGLVYGDKITIDGITSSWIFVQNENGEKGWCFGGYLSDKFPFIGYWIEEKYGREYYFFNEKKYVRGITEMAFIGGGTWFINGNKLQLNGKDEAPEYENYYSEDIDFQFFNYNKVKIGESIFTRIPEEDMGKIISWKIAEMERLFNRY